MGRKLSFIHAADLHLGAPFRGLRALSDAWADRLLKAIPEAFDRVVDAAIARAVD
ncbi:MAG TPA: metallophosphoesterase, partial [Candidatus Aveggerthella stercoripullorum]|nr:metallophosphoesterase [Candidatus Aveggerthella stercoripullorum]